MNNANHFSRPTLDRWATYREAMAQPKIWRAWSSSLQTHAAAVSTWVRSAQYDEIWLCGAGSSSFIGDTLAAYLDAPPNGPRYRSIPTTDLVSCPARFIRSDRRVLVVSFGPSGSSSETLGTLDLLDSCLPGADRLHFTCNAQGALATRSPLGTARQRVVVLPPETNDSGFAMTSSYSTMLLSALACLDENAPLPLPEAIDRLSDAAGDVLQTSLQGACADRRPPSRAVYLGCGPLTASARECALKVLELTHGRVPQAWDSTLGFRHGPKAVVDDRTRVHVFVSADPHTRRYDLDLASEVRRQFGAESVVTLGAERGNVDIHVPTVGNDAWTSVLYVLAGQMQAIAWADAHEIDVDNPFTEGNLSRVVDSVTLYPFQPAPQNDRRH
jgi:fructoselysine-6-P-deglycase FrlB-like protein